MTPDISQLFRTLSLHSLFIFKIGIQCTTKTSRFVSANFISAIQLRVTEPSYSGSEGIQLAFRRLSTMGNPV